MTLSELNDVLSVYEEKLSDDQRKLLRSQLDAVKAVFPFNDFEYRFSFLLDHGCMAFPEYEELRSRYVVGNEYLYLFGLSPRVFGEIWGQEHISSLDKRFQVPSKSLSAAYSGEYDLLLEDIKVEVKAARAINTKIRGDLVAKALRYESTQPFWMNFQQLKPAMCDVFVFIGVWVDCIKYWVLNSAEAKNSPYSSPQHRGGIEAQIGVKHTNLREFDKYAVDQGKVADKVIEKAGRSPSV